MKIDWRRKLSSRKFWMALIGFITPMLYLFNVAETDVATITSIIMSGASLIAYILAEGFIDGKSAESHTVNENYIIEEVFESIDEIGFKN